MSETPTFTNMFKKPRYRIGQGPSLLDCIFTNEGNMVENLHYFSGLGKSDHLVLEFKFICYITTNPNLSKKLNFAKGNYQEMIKVLENISWIEKLQGLSLTDSWEVFAAKLVQLIEKFVPESKVPQGKGKHNPVVNKRTLDAIKEKRRIWKKNINIAKMLTIGINIKPLEIR